MPSDPWDGVYDTLAAAEPDDLSLDELETLAEAAFWCGRPRETISARQKLYARLRDSDEIARATKTAWLLFCNHFDLDETAAAGGWLNRARRHAADIADQVEAGYVALAEAEWALYNGNLGDAVTHAIAATEAGRRHHDRDLEALSVAAQGRVLITQDNVPEGLNRLDEAMVAVLSDELTPFATGWVYCLLLATCQELGDVRRAAEWTELAVRWCQERGQESWYPGLCRLHQCEVRSLRGDWIVAEREALRAAAELAPFGDYLVADGQYLAGEIRRRRGDFAHAEDAFRQAHEHGRDPQPGLALLLMAHGDAEGAATSLRLAISSGTGGALRRGRLLAAHVSAELHVGRVEAAEGSATALAELAESSRSLLLRAFATAARGAVLLAAGEAAGALALLRDACAICRELSCPYEDAEIRVLIGLAARHLGDEATARLEFDAAKSSFARLGAAPDVQRVTALLTGNVTTPGGLTARELEVLRLVAHGRSNRQIASELVISEHTVARHLSNIFNKLDVTSRSAATSFAYEHDIA